MKNVQFPGGIEEVESVVIGKPRQVRIVTTDNSIRVHDGVTPGGSKILPEEGVRQLVAQSIGLGGSAAKVSYYVTESDMAEAVPTPDAVAVVGQAGVEDIYVWRNGVNDGGGVDSLVQGYWRRLDSSVGTYVRAWRAGQINMQLGGAKPVANQDTTAWLDGGAVKMWDGTDYYPATPVLYTRLLQKIGNYESSIILPDRLEAILVEVADLNTLTDTGWYKSKADDANAPSATPSLVFHSEIDANTMRQEFFTQGNAGRDSYVRFKTAGIWTAWIAVPGVLPTRLGATGLQVADCNSAVESGFYWVNNAAAHAPIAEAGCLYVVRQSATAGTQLFISIDSEGGLYTRKRLASTWSAWVPAANKFLANHLAAIVLADKMPFFDVSDSDKPSYATWAEIIAALGNSAADWRAKVADKILVSDAVWDAAAYVNLGNLTGNISLNLSSFIHAYGTATGNFVFNAVTNPKEQSGLIQITASGGNRTVGFNTAAFCTPDNLSLGTIPTGKSVQFSYARAQNGKIELIRVGALS